MDEIYALVAPEKIDMLSKLVESFENLGIVSTINQSQGLVVIRVTADTYSEVLEILTQLPFPVKILPPVQQN